jgi:hypothetical protein
MMKLCVLSAFFALLVCGACAAGTGRYSEANQSIQQRRDGSVVVIMHRSDAARGFDVNAGIRTAETEFIAHNPGEVNRQTMVAYPDMNTMVITTERAELFENLPNVDALGPPPNTVPLLRPESIPI